MEYLIVFILLLLVAVSCYFLGKLKEKNNNLNSHIKNNNEVNKLNDEVSKTVSNMSKSDLYKFLRK